MIQVAEDRNGRKQRWRIVSAGAASRQASGTGGDPNAELALLPTTRHLESRLSPIQQRAYRQ
jgi:hypothetical protein